MSAQPLIEILEKLLKLHKSLHGLALEKTEIIKKGNLDELNSLINREKKHITAIEKMEKDRASIVAKLLPDQATATLKDCLSIFEKTERERLQELREELIFKINELRNVNSLNQDLLQLSQQFVELNLDLLLPRDLPNYSKTSEDEQPLTNVSIFDSKA